MRQDPHQDFQDDDEEDVYRGPSKSQLKREQLELQALGKEMTGLGDEQVKRIGLPEDVLFEIKEFRRMRSFGAQRRQLQLIGKKMRDMDPRPCAKRSTARRASPVRPWRFCTAARRSATG